MVEKLQESFPKSSKHLHVEAAGCRWEEPSPMSQPFIGPLVPEGPWPVPQALAEAPVHTEWADPAVLGFHC